MMTPLERLRLLILGVSDDAARLRRVAVASRTPGEIAHITVGQRRAARTHRRDQGHAFQAADPQTRRTCHQAGG